MPKLDAKNLRYLTRDDFRALSAVEQGMKNHELVPIELIAKLAGLRHGGIHKVCSTLLKFKLVAHDRRKYDGYKLTYGGYDYLALRAMLQRGSISGLGSQIGVGKESDIFLATNAEGEELVLKLQRLGRTSFRAIKSKRDYLQHRTSASWLYMSRLGALKEYAFMTALKEAEFPVPTPLDCSRHAVLMSKVDGRVLSQVSTLTNPAAVFDQCMSMVIRMAQVGLVHCDFNEFNIMVSPAGVVTMIDFPQMVSTEHANADELFDRDVGGLVKYFGSRYGYVVPPGTTLLGHPVPPRLSDIPRTAALDATVAASGFKAHHAKVFADLADEGGQLFAHALAAQTDAAAIPAPESDEEEEEEDGGEGGAATAPAEGAGEEERGDGTLTLGAGAGEDDHDFTADPMAEGEGEEDIEGAAASGTAAAAAAGGSSSPHLPPLAAEEGGEGGPTEAELGRLPDGLRRRADGRRVLPARSHAVDLATKTALDKGRAARAAARGQPGLNLGMTEAEIRERVKRGLHKKARKTKSGPKLGRNKVKNREVTRLKAEATEVSQDRYW